MAQKTKLGLFGWFTRLWTPTGRAAAPAGDVARVVLADALVTGATLADALVTGATLRDGLA